MGYGQLFTILSERATGQYILISDGLTFYINYILFGLFIVFTWKKIQQIPQYPQQWMQSVICVSIAILLAYYPILYEWAPNTILKMYALLAMAGIGQICIFVGVFNTRFIRAFRFEVLFTILLIIIFYLSSVMIDQHWQYSSYVTFLGLRLILPLLPVTYTLNSEIFEVTVEDFTVFIGPPCAGIHSLMTFVILFLVWIFLTIHRQRFAWGRVCFIFLAGIVGVFLVNTIRVILILLVGAWYSQEFAVTVFHHNIGAILLLLFILLFFKWVAPFMRKSALDIDDSTEV
jgi:exosortase/archaeosortase family protein